MNKSPTPTSKDIFHTASSSNENLFMRYGLNRVQLLLQVYDNKMPSDEAAALASITIYDAQILVERACQVTRITTKRGQSRFTKPVDSETDTLSPLSLQYQSDLRLLSPLRSNAYQLRHQSEPDWQWFMLICRQRLSNSRVFVPFLEKEKKELQRFVDIAKRLLPDKNWLINGSETVLEKSIHSSHYKGMKQAQKDSVNAIHIGITNRDYRVKSKKSADNETDAAKKTTWQYSPLLRFFVHMML
ncbi:hypothetical protein [Psychrobacter frigidicola]|uniref:hypothetical protein n=1 Tax=Psychrobacter frigidicola TaxID=45611 RepID=UPI00191955E9|nr:hypothetical protein [Psychrobacter frigidicola]